MTDLPAPHSLRVPRWVNDDESISCFLCDQLFTFFNRRHHCRRCGLLVCNACSTHRLPIGDNTDGVFRCCDKCLAFSQTIQSASAEIEDPKAPAATRTPQRTQLRRFRRALLKNPSLSDAPTAVQCPFSPLVVAVDSPVPFPTFCCQLNLASSALMASNVACPPLWTVLDLSLLCYDVFDEV